MNKKERSIMNGRIKEHGEQLKAIFALSNEVDAIKLCRQLHNYERLAHGAALAYCNGLVNTEQYEKRMLPIKNKVLKLLYGNNQHILSIVFNSDARGYCIKIPSEYIYQHRIEIFTDLGGNGIIAPDFTP